jgi:uncharacterized membrane protein YeaQ/YmgE (transglycosylase-associated protein family)
MLTFVIILLALGFVVGLIARAVVPGNDALGIPGTILIGVAGSFVGGFLGYALRGDDIQDGAFQTSGVIGSIIGAVVVLLMYRFATRRA